MQKQLIDTIWLAVICVQFTFTDNQKAKSLNLTYKNLNHVYL